MTIIKTTWTILTLLCILMANPLTGMASQIDTGQKIQILYSNNVRGETEACG